ncbi:uncharacterized protein DNG_04423 [Cephalotrichum gorgonifer]|uniref:F-box domain-containing protein n=1 Tax=Cephalotrichum gorgonifer TaxID=2041049 RepID=A0AAE8MYQ7_9PEZI|nr:uncharacterized protein DNG_04423 [Cephalotrichum gorgonifer]
MALELFEAPVSPAFPTLPRIKDTLKELKLLHAVLEPWKLAELMKALPNLESLSYVEGLPITDSPHDLLGSASQIRTELLSTARHLRHLQLSLDARKQRMNKPPRPTDDQLLGSLRDMTALEELVLGAWYVTVPDKSTSFTDDMALVDILPASIRSVKLEVFGGEYTKSTVNFWAVMNLAASAPERFPSLRIIEFTFAGMTREEIYTMKTAYEIRGIEFTATSMPSKHRGT